MISIVIPTHNESLEIFKPLLNSINTQIGINFSQDIEILICSDAEHNSLKDADYSEYKNICDIIRFIDSPVKNNIGLNRQAGIDNAKGEYVFFCDADDMLFNAGVLRELRDIIEKDPVDMYCFDFIEEVPNAHDNTYINHPFNWTWCFAKAYRVQFLKDHGIRFNPNLKYHEDSYFNFLVRYADAEVRSIQKQAYLWKCRKDSITRNNNCEYSFVSWDEYLYAICVAIQHCEIMWKKDCKKDILEMAVQGYDILNNKLGSMYKGTKTYEKVERQYFWFLKTFLPIVMTDNPMPKILDNITDLWYNKKRDFFPSMTWYDHAKMVVKKYRGE